LRIVRISKRLFRKTTKAAKKSWRAEEAVGFLQLDDEVLAIEASCAGWIESLQDLFSR
jgi:hypothetical protein